MGTIKPALLLAVFQAFTAFLLCQAQDTIPAKKVKILPVPAFGFAPETQTYVGAVTLFTFHLHPDSTTRTSNAKVEINYTWRKQLIAECGWNYFSNKEQWFTKGLLHYSKYPDFYYGIGAQTPASNKLIFNSNRFVLDASLLRNIGKFWFTGITLKHIRYTNISAEKNIPAYAELHAGKLTSIGYALLKDTRNSLLTPASGLYFYVNAARNFSARNYWEALLDFRYYKTWKNNITLASRFVNDINTGTPPFFAYAFLGGDKFVRGYYYGRYRDNNLGTLQTEMRCPIKGRWAFATIGGLSSIYSSGNPFNLNQIKYNYGLGIRFMAERHDKINLRLDYAIGQSGNSGFYIAFGESF